MEGGRRKEVRYCILSKLCEGERIINIKSKRGTKVLPTATA